MKKLAMILIASAIGLCSVFAQIPDQRHPIQPRDNVANGAECINDRMEFLSERLDLTLQQKAKLEKLFTEQRAQREKAVEEHRAQMEKMREEHRAGMRQMAQKDREDIEKILTPEQIEIWNAMRAERQQRRMDAERHRHDAGPGHHRHHHPRPHHCHPCE